MENKGWDTTALFYFRCYCITLFFCLLLANLSLFSCLHPLPRTQLISILSIIATALITHLRICTRHCRKSTPRRRRINASMIGEPTNPQHTGHIGRGDMMASISVRSRGCGNSYMYIVWVYMYYICVWACVIGSNSSRRIRRPPLFSERTRTRTRAHTHTRTLTHTHIHTPV